MRMEEFLTILSKARRNKGYRVVFHDGLHASKMSFRRGNLLRIKSGKRVFCPVTLVCFLKHGVYFMSCEPYGAAKRLGLYSNTSVALVLASDAWNNETPMLIHRQLARALGIPAPGGLQPTGGKV